MPESSVDLPVQPSLADLESRIDELPLLPSVVAQLVALDPNAEDYFERVTRLASEDPPLAAQLVRIANSPISAPAEPIVSIAPAVTRLGAEFVAGLVTSLAVTRVFVPTTEAQKRLWLHSINVAVAARLFAKHLPEISSLCEAAYLAGLLHDIGRFVMFEHTPDVLQKVEESHWETPDELLQAEVEAFRFNHSELGYRAAVKWTFPELIADTIRYHHTRFDLGESSLSKPAETLLITVMTADCLAASLLDHAEFGEIDADVVKDRLAACHRPEWRHVPIGRLLTADTAAEIHDIGTELAVHLGVLSPVS